MEKTITIVVPGSSTDYVDSKLRSFYDDLPASVILEMALLTLPYQYEPEQLYSVIAEYMESEVVGEDFTTNLFAENLDEYFSLVTSAQQLIKPMLLGYDDRFLTNLSYANLACETKSPEPLLFVKLNCET